MPRSPRNLTLNLAPLAAADLLALATAPARAITGGTFGNTTPDADGFITDCGYDQMHTELIFAYRRTHCPGDGRDGGLYSRLVGRVDHV